MLSQEADVHLEKVHRLPVLINMYCVTTKDYAPHYRLYICYERGYGYMKNMYAVYCNDVMLVSHCGEYMANGLTNAVRHQFVMIANDRQTFVAVRKHSQSFLWCFEC